ncbi:MAG: NADH-quinone oxidoreductase subunit N, partial [Sphingobacterium sp.]|nr:NADH-quinone oxidoreductase subunit N [Sphingobacterium sp.]
YQNFQSFGLLVLLIVGALTSVISLFYYFKIPLNAFLRDNTVQSVQKFNPFLLSIALLCTILLVLLGLFPALLLKIF